MRSPLLFAFAFVFLLLALPASSQEPAQAKALAAIQTALKELPLGTPFEKVNQRDGFKYHKDLDLTVGKIDGVAILATFQDKKLSHITINDLMHSHRNLVAILRKEYGKPEIIKEPAQTAYVFKKEGRDPVTLKFLVGTITSVELGTPRVEAPPE